MGVWIVGLASAFGIKLTSSIDDVVWLAPFLTANSSVKIRFQNSVIYTAVCLTQTLVAMLIAYSGRSAIRLITHGAKNAWTTEKILTVGAGCLLSLYSVKLIYEYIQECNESEGEGEGSPDENPEGGNYAKVATSDGDGGNAEEAYDSGRQKGNWCCANPGPPGGGDEEMAQGKQMSGREMAVEIDNPEKSQDAIDKADKDRQQTLFVIAFIGSVDDLTLFVPMLVGKGFDLAQLMLGSFAAVALILTFCICLGLCKPIADCLARIPLCLIVVIFAVSLLLKAFVFDDGKDHLADGGDAVDAVGDAVTMLTTFLTSTPMPPPLLMPPS